MSKVIKFFFSFLTICVVGYLLVIRNEVKFLKQKSKKYGRLLGDVVKGYSYFTPFLGKFIVPYPLQNIPLGEDTGIVLDVKTIDIRNITAPYNATIVERGDGYLLFFRYDVIQKGFSDKFFTYIGCAELDSNFQQTEEEFRRIDTGSNHSEDPRALTVGDSLYLIYNDVNLSNPACRTMRVGKLNFTEAKLDYVTDLDLQIKPVEKNWVPFEYVDKEIPKLYLEYSLNPHKILKLEDTTVSTITHFVFPNFSLSPKFFWSALWGDYVKGGAPARKVDDVYLSFFHTFFLDEHKNAWYTMGAYAFDDKPPFRINAVSNYPILYKGIYNSPPLNTADPNKRVVFPGGFVEREVEGKKVIHLVCGENDCAVKVVTFDKERLIKGLKKI